MRGLISSAVGLRWAGIGRRRGWMLVEAAGAVVLLLALALVTGQSARSASRAIRAAKIMSVAQEWIDNHVEAIQAGTYLGGGELDLPDSAGALDLAAVGAQPIEIVRQLGVGRGAVRILAQVTVDRDSRLVPGGVEWTYRLTLSYPLYQLDGGDRTQTVTRSIRRTFPR